MIKSQPGWLGPGYELGISQIRVQCVATAPPNWWHSFYFVEYHHVKDFAASLLKRKISSVSWLKLSKFLIFTLI